MKIRFYRAGERRTSLVVGALLSLLILDANAVTLTELERTALVGKPLSLNLHLTEPNALRFSQLSSHCLQAKLLDSSGQERPLPLSFKRVSSEAGKLFIKDSSPVNSASLQIIVSSSCPLIAFTQTLTILPKIDRVVVPANQETSIRDNVTSVSRFDSDRSISLARTFVRPTGDSNLTPEANRDNPITDSIPSDQQESKSNPSFEKRVEIEDLEKASKAGLLVKAQMPSEVVAGRSGEIGSSTVELEEPTLVNESSIDNGLPAVATSASYQKWLLVVILLLAVTLYLKRRAGKVNQPNFVVDAERRQEPRIMGIDSIQPQAEDNETDSFVDGVISPTLLQAINESYLLDETSQKAESVDDGLAPEEEFTVATNYADNLIAELTKKVVEVPIEQWSLPDEVLNAVSVDQPLPSSANSEIYRVRILLSLIELSFRKAQIKLSLSESETKYLIQIGFSKVEVTGSMTLPIVEEFIKCRELELSSDDEVKLFRSNVESVANYFPEVVSEGSRSEWQDLTTGTEFASGQSTY